MLSESSGECSDNKETKSNVTSPKLDNIIKCVKHGTLDDLKKILAAGVFPVDLNDNNGWTPIHHAAYKGRTDMLRILLKGSKRKKMHLTNLKAWQNETPLMTACYSDEVKYDVVKLLLDNYVDPNACNIMCESPLHVICKKRGNLKIAMLMIENGADPNMQDDKDGFTPIMNAIFEAEDLDLVRYLLEKTDLTIKNRRRHDAMKLAMNFMPDAVEDIARMSCPTSDQIFEMLTSGYWDLYFKAASFCNEKSSFVAHRNSVFFDESNEDLAAKGVDLLTPLHFCMNSLETFERVLLSLPEDFFLYFDSYSLKINYLPQAIAQLSSIPEEILEAFLRFSEKTGHAQQMPPGTLASLDIKKQNILRKYYVIEETCRPTTLKSACRICFRKAIRSQFVNDWSAYCWLRDCLLPSSIKQHLLYEDKIEGEK